MYFVFKASFFPLSCLWVKIFTEYYPTAGGDVSYAFFTVNYEICIYSKIIHLL